MYNPQRPTCAVYVFVGLGKTSGVWSAFYGPQLKRKWVFLTENPSTVHGSSVVGGDLDPVPPFAGILTGFISCESCAGNHSWCDMCARAPHSPKDSFSPVWPKPQLSQSLHTPFFSVLQKWKVNRRGWRFFCSLVMFQKGPHSQFLIFQLDANVSFSFLSWRCLKRVLEYVKLASLHSTIQESAHYKPC